MKRGKVVEDGEESKELEGDLEEFMTEYELESEAKELESEAKELLKSPDFFYKLGKIFSYGFVLPELNKPRFILGEEANKRLLPILLMAVKRGYVTLIQVVGEPGTGKDSMVRMSLFLLKKAVKCIERGYFTPAAMRYSEELKEADILYIPDIDLVVGEMERQFRLMRTSDGGIISEYAYMNPKTKQMETAVVKMPVKGIITTTNVRRISSALKSGMWRIELSSDPKFTEEVIEVWLKHLEGKKDVLPHDAKELKVWQEAFRIIATVDVDPIIPYATELKDLIPSERSESRRYPLKLGGLIKQIAICRYFQKPESLRDRADLVDLAIALRLGYNALEHSIFELTKQERYILQVVLDLCSENGEGVTVNQVFDVVGEKLGYSRRTIYGKLEDLVDKGYLIKEGRGGRRGNIYRPAYKLVSEFPSNLQKEKEKFAFGCNANLDDVSGVIQYIKGLIRKFANLHRDISKVREMAGGEYVDPITGEKVSFNDLVYEVVAEEVEAFIRERGGRISGKEFVQFLESEFGFSKPDIKEFLEKYRGSRFKIEKQGGEYIIHLTVRPLPHRQRRGRTLTTTSMQICKFPYQLESELKYVKRDKKICNTN